MDIFLCLSIRLLQKKSLIIETQKNKVKSTTRSDLICFGKRDKKVLKSLSYDRKESLVQKNHLPVPLMRDL